MHDFAKAEKTSQPTLFWQQWTEVQSFSTSPQPPWHVTGRSGALPGVCCLDDAILVHYLPDVDIILQKKCWFWQFGWRYLQSISQIRHLKSASKSSRMKELNNASSTCKILGHSAKSWIILWGLLFFCSNKTRADHPLFPNLSLSYLTSLLSGKPFGVSDLAVTVKAIKLITGLQKY